MEPNSTFGTRCGQTTYLVDQVKCCFCFLISDENFSCLPVYPAHEKHLLIALRYIPLNDAESVNPNDGYGSICEVDEAHVPGLSVTEMSIPSQLMLNSSVEFPQTYDKASKRVRNSLASNDVILNLQAIGSSALVAGSKCRSRISVGDASG
jgi:hypothetical protein